MEPLVSLKLTGGEGHKKLDLEFYVSLGLEHCGDLDVWVLHWINEDGLNVRPMFPEAGRALKILKCLLDQKTGQWTSLVAFQDSRVDS